MKVPVWKTLAGTAVALAIIFGCNIALDQDGGDAAPPPPAQGLNGPSAQQQWSVVAGAGIDQPPSSSFQDAIEHGYKRGVDARP